MTLMTRASWYEVCVWVGLAVGSGAGEEVGVAACVLVAVGSGVDEDVGVAASVLV